MFWFFSRNKNIKIEPYVRLKVGDRLYIIGRVLVDKRIDLEKPGLFSALKRFFLSMASAELSNVEVQWSYSEDTGSVVTDREGYFTISIFPLAAGIDYSRLRVKLNCRDTESVFSISNYTGKEPYILISDIDDTVLKTEVTSIYGLKKYYNTAFKSPAQREGVSKMAESMGSIHHSGMPILYVSNAPRNLHATYSYILDLLGFPDGPIFLRDIGRQMILDRNRVPEKLDTIRTIAELWPSSQFFLVGDSAEKDLTYYLSLYDEFPDRVRGIYIRVVEENKKSLEIIEVIEKRSEVNIQLFQDAKSLSRMVLEITS